MNNFLNGITNRFLNLFRGQSIAGGNSEAIARLSAAANALTYFEGYAPQTLKVEFDKPDDNVHINYAEVIVSKGVAFLFGENLKISIGTDEDKSGEELLEQLWPEDARAEDFTEAATEGGISGDVYLKISIQADGKPRVTVGDPNTYQVETDPHDVTRARRFVCQYEIPGTGDNSAVYRFQAPSGNKNILYKEETTRAADGKSWQIQEFHSYNGGNSWSPVSDGVTWNFSFAPIFHCKNLPNSKSFHGRADLRHDVLRLISAISRIDSLCNKVVRAHSTPKPYATGLRKQDLEMGTDKMMYLPAQGIGNIEPKLALLEMKGDLSGAREFRKDLREGLAEMTKVPEVASGKLPKVGAIPGVALRIMHGPLLDQTKVKRRLYGKMIKDAVIALLTVAGKSELAKSVQLHWGDPLPSNEVEAVAVAEGKKRLGFSEQTLISELGGDAAKEKEQRANDSQTMASTMLGAFDNGAGADQLAA
jgi:hypothetical protein